MQTVKDRPGHDRRYALYRAKNSCAKRDGRRRMPFEEGLAGHHRLVSGEFGLDCARQIGRVSELITSAITRIADSIQSGPPKRQIVVVAGSGKRAGEPSPVGLETAAAALDPFMQGALQNPMRVAPDAVRAPHSNDFRMHGGLRSIRTFSKLGAGETRPEIDSPGHPPALHESHEQIVIEGELKATDRCRRPVRKCAAARNRFPAGYNPSASSANLDAAEESNTSRRDCLH